MDQRRINFQPARASRPRFCVHCGACHPQPAGNDQAKYRFCCGCATEVQMGPQRPTGITIDERGSIVPCPAKIIAEKPFLSVQNCLSYLDAQSRPSGGSRGCYRGARWRSCAGGCALGSTGCGCRCRRSDHTQNFRCRRRSHSRLRRMFQGRPRWHHVEGRGDRRLGRNHDHRSWRSHRIQRRTVLLAGRCRDGLWRNCDRSCRLSPALPSPSGAARADWNPEKP